MTLLLYEKLSQTLSHPLKFGSWLLAKSSDNTTLNKKSKFVKNCRWRASHIWWGSSTIIDFRRDCCNAGPTLKGNYVIIIYTQFINCHGFEHLEWALCKVWRELPLKEWSCCNTLTQHCLQISPWAKNSSQKCIFCYLRNFKTRYLNTITVWATPST